MSEEIKSKEIYTEEEKKLILQRLDAQRKARQEGEASLDDKKPLSDADEKKKILDRINEERRIAQKYKELQKQRLKNKKVYTLANKTLYKFLEMDRSYYIQVEDCKMLSSRPQIFSLYYQGFDGLKKKDVLIQVKDYSDKIFISDDLIKIYFKQYALEDNPKQL